MTSQNEKYPTPVIEKVSGEHIDVDFIDPSQIQVFLEEHRGYKAIYTGRDEDLARPLKEIDIGYHRDALSDNITFEAAIKFESSSVIESDARDWQDIISQFMKEYLEHKDRYIYQLAHDNNGFYVHLDANYAAYVSLTSSVHTCDVNLSIVRLNEIDLALEMQHENIVDTKPVETNFYELFKQFSIVLTTAVDATISNYGDSSIPGLLEKPHIAIALPNPLRSSQAEFTEPEFKETVDISTSTQLSLDMIGGATDAKHKLEDYIIAFTNPGLANEFQVQASNFILHGPPGTGKTMLAKAFADTVDARLIEVDSTEIIDMYVGNSAKNLQAVFESADSASDDQRVVLFFDEINALIGKHGGGREYVNVVELFKKLLTDNTQNDQLIIVGATNVDVAKLDDAIVRSGRFDTIYVPVPNDEERKDVWAAVLWNSIQHFSNGGLSMKDLETSVHPYEDAIDVIELAKITDGMTGADFEQILIRSRAQKMIHAYHTGERSKVSQSDIIQHIRRFNT